MSGTLRTLWKTPGAGAWLALAGVTLAYAAFVIWRSSPESFYTLDDPFIHLALAENLARGHFGVNLGEVSNPSSSILWPWLMVMLRPVLGVWAPLVVNIVCFLATAWLLIGFTRRHLVEGRKGLNALILAALVFLAVNMFAVMFTGQEHSLHLLVSVIVVTHALERRYDRLMFAAMVLSPLVRFEGLAVLAFGVGAGIVDGKWKFAALAGVVAAVTGGAYLAWLSSMGLPLLPSSVLVKSETAGGLDRGMRAIFSNLYHNMIYFQASWFWIAVSLLAVWRRRGRERIMALGLFGMLGLGLTFGPLGGYPRYEVYLFGSVAAGLIYLLRRELKALTGSLPLTLAAGLACLAINAQFGILALRTTPQAARNIHQQQHQLHRFITECWKRPVAANDLGWISYRNDAYVLDLWGLGSEDARKARAANEPDWMAKLATRHGVDAALIYKGWFSGIPASWTRVGEFRITEESTSPADPVVDVYATRPEAAPEIVRCLEQIRPTLPEGSAINIG